MPTAIWETWDEPERQVAVVQQVGRGIHVVFPVAWAAQHGGRSMIQRAKQRIQEIETKSGRTLVPGSVLLAFSEHEPTAPRETFLPDVARRLM